MPAALLLWTLFLITLAGCASPAARQLNDSDKQQAANTLTEELMALGPTADLWEARMIAETAVAEANALGIRYRAVRPPWFHNMLVNAKLKPRGLCYHWANDLWRKLTDLPVHSFELHFAVARLDTPREHNAIVVTLRGQPFAEGVVLDAWRRSGILTWSRVAGDKYPWRPLQ